MARWYSRCLTATAAAVAHSSHEALWSRGPDIMRSHYAHKRYAPMQMQTGKHQHRLHRTGGGCRRTRISAERTKPLASSCFTCGIVCVSSSAEFVMASRVKATASQRGEATRDEERTSRSECVVGCVVSVAAPKRGSNVATVGVAVLAGKQNEIETKSNQSMHACMYVSTSRAHTKPSCCW